MKDHKWVKRQVNDVGPTPLDDFIEKLHDLCVDMVDPVFEMEQGYDYADMLVGGWVPMTPEEIHKQQALETRKRQSDAKRKQTRVDKFLKEAKALGYDVSR